MGMPPSSSQRPWGIPWRTGGLGWRGTGESDPITSLLKSGKSETWKTEPWIVLDNEETNEWTNEWTANYRINRQLPTPTPPDRLVFQDHFPITAFPVRLFHLLQYSVRLKMQSGFTFWWMLTACLGRVEPLISARHLQLEHGHCTS